jgi:hypothetical protein
MAAGRKTGGRQKGSLNKATQQQRDAVAASGLAPLDYMLSVMRDDKQPAERRDDMAKAAAPYVHSKLAAIEHTGANGGPIVIKATKEQRDAAVSAALRADTDA